MAAYVDRCVLLSPLLGDSGYTDSERWLINQGDQTLWISHWVLLEVAGVIATCVRRGQLTAEQAQTIGSEFESFRQERLALIEPRGTDFLQARQWLKRCLHLLLRFSDALNLDSGPAPATHRGERGPCPCWLCGDPGLAGLCCRGSYEEEPLPLPADRSSLLSSIELVAKRLK